MATHRRGVIENADRVLVLNQSRLVDVGTHRELLESNAEYRSMVAD
jgi:ABC-type multidrug transport system fused ATPase/permease subunit